MLKRILKQIIKREHWEFMGWYKSRFSLVGALGAYVNLLAHKGIGRVPIDFGKRSVFIRPGTADQGVFDQIFVRKDYRMELGDPHLIVDAGAHIGLASVYFANRFPQARIVAIEPEPANFKMLLKNTRDYPNISVLQAGLWSGKTHLQIQDSNVDNWSFRVAETVGAGGILALGVQDVMKSANANQIDILKIDIEGSEVEVLSSSVSWLGNVQNMIIELHDRFRPGCSEALDAALNGYEYVKFVSGENIVISHLCRVTSETIAPFL